MNPKNISSLKYCVYLLTSINPRFQNHTYIGKTTDPTRRIRQHNGLISGGAFKTESKRPWEMIVVVHSFPTEKKVLQFEWDWQHPEKATRIKEAYEKLKGKHIGSMYSVSYKLHLLAEMLQTPIYRRLPLGIYITTHRYDDILRTCPQIPKQITIQFGEIGKVMQYVGSVNLKKRKRKVENNMLDNVQMSTQSELSELISQFTLDEATRRSQLMNINSNHQIPSPENQCDICHQRIQLNHKIVNVIHVYLFLFLYYMF